MSASVETGPPSAGTPVAPAVETRWRPARPVAVAATLAPLRRGGGDPAHQLAADGAVWRTTRDPDDRPATLRLLADRSGGTVLVQAWGAGAAWAAASAPDLLGRGDDDTGFAALLPPPLAALAARHPGLPVPRSRRVLESLVPAILEQKVTGLEARRSWRQLLLRFGEPAPGPAPAGMRVPPTAAQWRRVPSWEWHAAGVGPQRADTAMRAVRVAARLEECVDLPLPEAHARLQAVPGIGAWTSAEVAQRALGDADAVSVGDFHLAGHVGWALTGVRGCDDARMLELLAPFQPHRYRVTRLLERGVARAERHGPRYSPRDYRRI